MSDPATHVLVHDLLARFFQAFDDKNWPALRGCLCDEVFTDYSSFRAMPAVTVRADEYVEQRRMALQGLEMQHNFLNLRVEPDATAAAATARCNYVIHRFHPSCDGAHDLYFHSYGHYLFALVAVDGTWRISRITQSLLRNQGNREIHGAIQTA
jgi:SnoaL-like protein